MALSGDVRCLFMELSIGEIMTPIMTVLWFKCCASKFLYRNGLVIKNEVCQSGLV